MRQFGLIGKSLIHSFSGDYFNRKFSDSGIKDAQFSMFSIPDISQIRDVISANPFLLGLSVTIPYKTDIIDYIDDLDEPAKAIGAVNSLKIIRQGDKIRIKGFNTDYLGFIDSLKTADYKKFKKALILGTGGASKAVAYALKILNIDFRFVSRDPKNLTIYSYSDLSKEVLSRYSLIINTTPLGMYPDIKTYPDIPYQHLNSQHLLFDLVYNPRETVFLNKGLQQNTYICNGLNMLYAQADYSWKIWNNEAI